MTRLTTLSSLLAVLAATSLPPSPSHASTLGVVLENDWFQGGDGHYTGGARVVWAPGPDRPAPQWAAGLARQLPWFPGRGRVRHGYAFGQSVFVPNDISLADPPLTDRPYAGWLYGSIGLAAESGRQLDQIGLTLGIVGPASGAEQTQKFLHEVFGSEEPQGWETQLKNEPGLILTYQRSWRGLARTQGAGAELDWTPHVGGAVGNVLTYASAGVTLRYGKGLPDDYGAPRILPALPGSSDFSPASDFGWYLFAGVDGRAVIRNLFLDGNTFRNSRDVDRRPFVGDLQFGFVVDWPAVRLSYTHVVQTRDFRTQDGNDGFGALSLTFKY